MIRPAIFTLPDDQSTLEARLAPRRNLYDRGLISQVFALFDSVRAHGDVAVREATAKFDIVDIDAIAVEESYVDACVQELSSELRAAALHAAENIAQFNRELRPEPIWTKEVAPGRIVGEKTTPLDSVGLWIPSRKGPLLSTALMLVTAAKVAGVREIQVGMPPSADGRPDPATVAAAKLAGAGRFLCGNGVGIIAGWSVGTESIPKVDGVFGPGPGGIAAAMSAAFSYGVKTVLGIGPTDSLIIADHSADPATTARDLLNEAEHGPDSCSVLVTTSADLADQVATEVARIAETFPEKQETLDHSFGPDGLSAIIVVPDLDRAVDFANQFAPEHGIVQVESTDETRVVDSIAHCGELLLGGSTPFSAGNYAVGITAVLPTNGFARSVSGITCRDMMKTTTIGRLSPSALSALHPTIAALGEHEGLPWHVEASRYRTEEAD